ncbi:hypothetical protein F5880DRAFT_752493 [Lentinula raphanica]|nr:hypothetical protein F5880DRAFT_752493 [Lentinula raphanica]
MCPEASSNYWFKDFNTVHPKFWILRIPIMPASTRIQISQHLAMLTPCPRGSDVLFECVRAKCGMCLELGWIRLASRWRLQSKTVQETQIDYLLKRSRCFVLTAHTPLDTTGYNHVHPIYCLSLAIFVSNLLCLSSILRSTTPITLKILEYSNSTQSTDFVLILLLD